jgi:hypothetical protein
MKKATPAGPGRELKRLKRELAVLDICRDEINARRVALIRQIAVSQADGNGGSVVLRFPGPRSARPRKA